ncbi:MAG: membrane protein insertion efficiency factor YidD [Verrucomicrobiales bacterium]
MKPFLIGLLRFYQIVISRPLHWLGGPTAGCRFTPTCSQYCLDAIRSNGSLKGLWLGLRRIARCHPWGGHGHDPVPAPRDGSPPCASPTGHASGD